jgi:hypothetical protein
VAFFVTDNSKPARSRATWRDCRQATVIRYLLTFLFLSFPIASQRPGFFFARTTRQGSAGIFFQQTACKRNVGFLKIQNLNIFQKKV